MLKEQRLKILKDTLEKFGVVERFEVNGADNSVYAEFAQKEEANKAIDTLKKEYRTLTDSIRASLSAQKQPASLCPNFHRYHYSLVASRIPHGTAKAAHNKPNNAFGGASFKNVVANPKD